jgi:succinate dehydrogenase/fumarate reductase cytochrome b subunit
MPSYVLFLKREGTFRARRVSPRQLIRRIALRLHRLAGLAPTGLFLWEFIVTIEVYFTAREAAEYLRS